MLSYPVAVSGNLIVFRSKPSGRRVMLLLLRLPSELRGIQEQHWHLHLEFAYVDRIGADDSQDLLIFSYLGGIHVRTLSTGGIHPLTNTPGFIYLRPPSDSPLYIYDDLLATSIYESPSEVFLVLNWKTGEQIVKIVRFPLITKIVFPYRVYDPEPVMHLRVVALPDTPDDSPLRSYDFVLDIPNLGDRDSYRTEYLCMNTLPSNPSDSSFPGLFHADPRNRLLALDVETIDPEQGFHRVQALYVTQATLLSYIATHPSDADTVSVPWEAWGPRNTHIVNLPPHATRDKDRHMITCGMNALIEFRDHRKLHIMDYHPGRIARIMATHDAHLACTGGTVTGEGSRHSDVTVVQRPNTGTLSDTDNIRYAPKDIPIPDGLWLSWNTKCVLGEDVVALLEFSRDNENNGKLAIFYHTI
ncbi:hypothetical protein BJV78DRAFT_1198565 [Lactifluus subvellereus]|nr:hypothetical protein BJV78DRAFT_1198565 [Lactifluus subvellereus]